MVYHDAHNHLQDAWLARHLDGIAAQLESLPLGTAVVNGTCQGDWQAVADLAGRFQWVRPSYGLHPWDVGNREERWLEELEARLNRDPRAGVGEVGLDRWILDSAKPDDPRLAGMRRAPLDEQIETFVAQIELAAKSNRMLSIHCLQAWGALETVLKSCRLPSRGFLLHAYVGSREMARTFADLGAYFSFNGAFLEDRKVAIREVYRFLPEDRLLAETDAPAMPPPQTWRTHKLPPAEGGSAVNHPGNIEVAYAGLAQLRGRTLDEIAGQLDANFRRWAD